MSRKRQLNRHLLNKQNIGEPLLQEAIACDKLQTLSQDDLEQTAQSNKVEFSGWFNDTVLVDRINKIRRKKSLLVKREETIRISANKIVLEVRKKNTAEQVDSRADIELLKKEAAFLSADNPEDNCDQPFRIKSRFPKKQDLTMTVNPPRPDRTLQFEEDPIAPIQSNYFCSRQKYSAIDQNRKKIKGINKSMVESSHLTTDASLKCSVSNIEAICREFKHQRPYSSFVRKTDRVNSQKTATDRINVPTHSQLRQSTEQKSMTGATIYRNRYIHEGFKRCRMHKRNRSARLSFSQAASIPHKYNQLVQGSRIRQSIQQHAEGV